MKSLVKRTPGSVPRTSGDGQLMAYAGRYAGDIVLSVFEQIGGAAAMAEWAEENRGEFYTKLFAKTIVRQSEVRNEDSIGALLRKLDDDIIDVTPDEVS